ARLPKLQKTYLMLNKLILVGIGGFAGSVLRYLISGYAQDFSGSIGFPYGTLAVNLAGCFVIGFLSQLADARGVFTSDTRALVFIGIMGGFTTFSTFGNETMNLFRDGESGYALANIGAHIFLGLFFVWVGRSLSFLIWR
ncbi:MAG TPA: fluoride efflux transporter CrcB, partial [Blastocatellia bacterium]|nr:fluoride efflux transporter CrcB [Blastocatellia bacterium]